MTVKLKVYSDFTCPYCYLAESVIQSAAEGKDVELEWVPLELHPFPSPTKEWKDVKESWESSVLPYAKELGITIKHPEATSLPYTHLALQGYIYAKEQGRAQDYVKRVFTAFFEEGKDIGSKDILTEIAEQSGLNQDSFRSVLDSDEYDRKLNEIREEIKAENITAAPTMVIGERRLKGLYPQKAVEKAIRCGIRDEKMHFCEGDECY
ncbi:Predicted dithiol-disulfide isomerase, DsbA family [Fictibacillus solisalsi]|uniref:Predicted dithiol-disulfide isomerase, DsbA family n=1 Tax=Fictibacillus solisalsi TaxID=459525 RepID=A0A1G9UBU4_9BACL|nr:DsbA family protein [Fictibacillus solisalsi]SDM57437.1 Predicted dithiol-disulfide isomerase, DsbA family [Fictibacillus solisalsi]